MRDTNQISKKKQLFLTVQRILYIILLYLTNKILYL